VADGRLQLLYKDFSAAPLVIPGSVLGLNGAVAPSSRIVLGGLGIGGRGAEVLRERVPHVMMGLLGAPGTGKQFLKSGDLSSELVKLDSRRIFIDKLIPFCIVEVVLILLHIGHMS
jgi:hypothetical protein